MAEKTDINKHLDAILVHHIATVFGADIEHVKELLQKKAIPNVEESYSKIRKFVKGKND